MGNGTNEPVQFTRGDAERLAIVVKSHASLHRKMDELLKEWRDYRDVHATEHETLKEKVEENARFRRTVTRVLLFFFTTSTGLGLIAAGAKALGWF